MLAFRWETGARRYELTLEQDLLNDLLLRRAWAGKANKHGAGKMQVFLDEQAALREVEMVCGRRLAHGYNLVRADYS
jgi:predicted DNA-binding WGR domain protein